ncbi:glutathione S-transferase [Paremcibacter congregatus]|uniref:glutathione S-transferase n=1 Tax=Paremcibacter congregatus TaxID=2043170 RepID=UPI003A8F270A|tara:strand:+ start:1787 stop:2422 length:636 start_codon:yes stop_codon:yes gene_type:complete
MSQLPHLYSFRRCPYAMRARLGLTYAGVSCELREVVLRDKPREMIALSPKATVPVLQLPDGRVIDESYDIILWALEQNDPDDWRAFLPATEPLRQKNDGCFKAALDKYKYASRFPEQPAEEYRADGMLFLQELEDRLSHFRFLLADRQTVADISLFPFVRQFAHVDRDWFFAQPLPHLQRWLTYHLDSDMFKGIMKKYPQWHPDDTPVLFP